MAVSKINVELDPGEGVFVAASGSVSSQASANASGSGEPDGIPGAAVAFIEAGAGGGIDASFNTTAPVQVDFSASFTSGAGSASLSSSQGTVFEGAGSFSGVLPAGAISVQGSAGTGAETECLNVDGCLFGGSASASFSFSLTISEVSPVIRWVNAAGGSWDEPTNWDPEQVPGDADTALFDLPGSYAVTFPAGAPASAGVPRGVGSTCAQTRPVQATQVRAGEITYTGSVDLSTLSESTAAPGFRVGGEADGDDPQVFLEGGQLCSIFSTVGDRPVSGRAEVAVLGGTWRNEGRLRVGDLGEGLLQIAGGEVIAAETRVGEIAGGEIVMDAPADLETGALLVGAPALGNFETARVRIVGGTAQSDTTLVGAAVAVCAAGGGGPTDIPCSTDRDCESVFGTCVRSQSLEIEGGAWSAFDRVFVGGGTIVDDLGGVTQAAGNGLLLVTGGTASVPRLTLGTDTVRPGDSRATVSLGQAVVGGGVLEVFGPIDVGNGGRGLLRVEGSGRASSTGPTNVGLPTGLALAVSGFFGHLHVRSLFETTRLTVDRHGLLDVDGGRAVASERVDIFSGGTVRGNGTIVAPEAEAHEGARFGATVPIVVPAGAPASARGAASAGDLVFEGNLTVRSGAVLEVTAAGPGLCPRVQVTGNAALAGTLELVFRDGYVPQAGDACEVLVVDGATTGGFERIAVRGVAEGFLYQATPTAGGVAFEALSDATPCDGDDADGDGAPDCERCDDCADDDGDGLVDRDDPDCQAPANGAGTGLADPGQARDALRCHAALSRAAKDVATKSWKLVQKCTAAVHECHQQKPGDARCTDKAAAKCAKAAAKLEGAKSPAARAEAKVAKACAGLPADAWRDPEGLGFAAKAGACATVGVPALDSAEALARCGTRRQLCQLGELVGLAMPRAGELLSEAGAGGVLPCLPQLTDGGGQGLGDPKGAGKRAVACQKALDKASLSLLGSALDAEGRCTGALLACVQTRPGDAACLSRAADACAREEDRVASAEAKLLATLEKKCGEKKGQELVTLADLLAPAGLGFEGAAPRCAEVGVPALGAREDVGQCLAAEEACRAAQMGEASAPRASELRGF